MSEAATAAIVDAYIAILRAHIAAGHIQLAQRAAHLLHAYLVTLAIQADRRAVGLPKTAADTNER